MEMTRTVYKYNIHVNEVCSICVEGSDPKVLHFDYQGGSVYVWIEVEANKSYCKYVRFHLVGTGYKLHTDLYNYTHVNSFITPAHEIYHGYILT